MEKGRRQIGCQDFFPRLQLLEQQMRQPPGYRPRGMGGCLTWKSGKAAGNYSEIVDCVICGCKMEHLKNGKGIWKRRKGTDFYDSRHRKNFLPCWCKTEKEPVRTSNYAAAVFLLSADENLWEKVSKQVLDTGIYLTASGLAASHWNNISCSMRLEMYLGTKHIRLSELTDRVIPDEIFRLIVNAFVMERYGWTSWRQGGVE